MSPSPESPFLRVPRDAWLAENDLAFAVRDRHPVSPGHALVIPKRVVATWFDATRDEQLAVLALIDEVKRQLDRREPKPDGYNVGFNAGEAAGQTVMHLHVHVIPRYLGDMDDPRGGVRHVIPSKGNYLHVVPPLAAGGRTDPFARHILPLLEIANDVAILAAFVQESGLERVGPVLRDALARGADVRLLTGDYLEITQVAALELLLDWQSATAMDDDDSEGEERSVLGRLEARVVQVQHLPDGTRSFHPKSWRFESPRFGVAFVGSSNLSRAALDTAIEWNLRVDRDRDRHAYDRIVEEFDNLWRLATPLTSGFVADYAERVAARPHTLPVGDLETEPLRSLPDPHAAQANALAKLRDARSEGRQRALVVLATGLGKTLLSALDYEQVIEETGRRPRLLFLAHRRELLKQAAATFRALLRRRGERATVGWFVEDVSQLHADLVFASVSKLARTEHLERLRTEGFEYVVVDEVHHAAADSYRRIIDALDPQFLLGLTATPDRADAQDILGLFDDHVAYRAGIAEGIELGRLVPFRYFGVKDDIDYENIPWRNRRFDPDKLAAAAQTEARMDSMWRAWNAHPGRRTLLFCCSIAHALFVKAWLAARGIRVAAIFSGEGSDDRDVVLRRLEDGAIDALCAVDVFNEGIDIPLLDRVVMLRPTESNVVFLQQLGRGLRALPAESAHEKSALTVIDFVGNHRMFLDRLRALLALRSGGLEELRALLRGADAMELPEGCSVDLDLEAKDLLSRLFRVGGTDEIERVYRELREARGIRPTAGELLRMGYLPMRLRERHGSWLDFVRTEADLKPAEERAFEAASGFLRDLEITEMSKSFKMVTLQVLLDHESLFAGMELPELARRALAILRRSPELLTDVPDAMRADDSDRSRDREWISYWRQNPITAWTGARKKGRAWFKLDGDRFVVDLPIDASLHAALARLVAELVDYRLVQYRRRESSAGAALDGFVCRVTWNKRDPILKLPVRTSGRVPEGEVDARLEDGSVWVFRFAKEFCNVARPASAQTNQLPDLLRRWFGPAAGQPGTAFQVRFRASPDGLWVEPERGDGGQLLAFPRRAIASYPDLRAAAGHVDRATERPDAEQVVLPVDASDPDLFAVRVSGASMDGGRAPLRDGDWAIFRWARGALASAMQGRIALLEIPAEIGNSYLIKRVVKRDGGWFLASDNPAGPEIPGEEHITVIARFERAFRPEALAPDVGATIAETDLAGSFGVDDLEPRSARHGGHLFVFIDAKGMLETTEHVHFPGARRPGETAYVLAGRPDGSWRYLGVGRVDESDRWRIPEVDHDTWRAWGASEGVSRELPEGARATAQVAIDALLALPEDERWIERPDGRRAQIVGAAPRGGLRIAGANGSFAERTVSVVDVAWVAAASEEAGIRDGQLDEARVNRHRYLEGTPKGSTRWIDTGWALAAWTRARTLLPTVTDSTQIADDKGRLLDARFCVEEHEGVLSVIVESRGGTRGSAGERNKDYNEGLELLLTRLKALGAVLADALVESAATRGLAHAQRTLALPDRPYPVSIGDAAELRNALGGAQARTGREPGARGGGNRTKRVRFILRFPNEQPTPAALVAALSARSRA